MPRPPLERAIRDPGFTPSRRDVGALVDLLADDELAQYAERAIARTGAAALTLLGDRFRTAVPPLRARILRAVARLSYDAGARAMLLGALYDADPKTRRNAAIALGHVRAEGVEVALLQTWSRDARTEMRRSVAASLGKVGTPAALVVLREAAASDDAELSRIAQQAVFRIERTASRKDRGRIDPERVADRPFEVEVLARRGIEGLLVDELGSAVGLEDARVVAPGTVRVRMVGAMSRLFAARTMLSFRFPLGPAWIGEDEPIEEATARALTGDEARRIFSTFTVGAVRYRIAWAEGGHRRALTFRTVRAVARRAPDFVNDPTDCVWEVVVGTAAPFDAAIAPQGLIDPRFAWRRRDVPAASHPTLAAALVRVAGVRDDDAVWDPFVGSGAELVERARAGPYLSLIGSDVDARALAAARENIDAAGVRAALEQADALTYTPPGVTVIVTNPPMGRRACRTPDNATMLDRFVAHAAAVLPAAGRLVWISPAPRRTRGIAHDAGLTLDFAQTVDMGGFDGEMQRWTKRH